MVQVGPSDEGRERDTRVILVCWLACVRLCALGGLKGSGMNTSNLDANMLVCLSGLGLAWAAVLFWRMLRTPVIHAGVLNIGLAIQQGSATYLKKQYQVMGGCVLLLAVLIGGLIDRPTAAALVLGALCSATAGWVGMAAATRANMHTAVAAQEQGLAGAFGCAFSGGAIMGLMVAGLGLWGVSSLFSYGMTHFHDLHALHGFGMGASTVALFARVGGGIFTKSADVGADLAGKLEAHLPEDDPRNPGVIADNVGDNVGDIAGMGSDVFESYCGAMIATIAMAGTLSSEQVIVLAPDRLILLLLPLQLAGVGLIASLVGVGVVRWTSSCSPAASLRSGTLVAAGVFVVAAWGFLHHLGVHPGLVHALTAGAVGGVLMGLITEHVTGGRPVQAIAQAGTTGSATVVIAGLALGLRSVVLPVSILAAVMGISTHGAGVYGVGLAAVGMLATVGMTMSVDAFGPVADNAGGIAEMAGMGVATRAITDQLDQVGNTTAAMGKGFASGAAALSALAIITAFGHTLKMQHPEFSLDLAQPMVLIGVFLGGILPYFLASLMMTAVGDAAGAVVQEIRRQWNAIQGLREGKAAPDTERCVGIATQAALHKMMLPACMAVGTPMVVGFGLGPEALGGMLVGALLSCVLLALFMANAGAAWDNAKKYVEQGHLGGKGSTVHQATVVGDTLGDPFKDTAGPSMNILINVMAMVSLVIAPVL